MRKNVHALVGPGAVILSAVLFGTMPLMAKRAFALGSNAYTTAFGRFATGAVIAGLVILLHPKQTIRINKKQFRALLLLSLFYAATPVLLYSSYQSIDSGLASTLHFTYPIAVMLLSALLFRDRVGRRELLCAILCMAGVLLLYTPGSKADGSGMVIAALSGLVYAGYIVALGKTGNLTLDLPKEVWLSYLGLGLFATVLALALFQIGVFLCGPVKASLLSTFEPLTGVVIGILVFHETLTVKSACGLLLILLAVILLARPVEKQIYKKQIVK